MKGIDVHGGGRAAVSGRGLSLRSDARTVCGNPKCSSRWLARLKDRRRPMFEGRWACGADCMSALVVAAIRREAANKDLHIDNVPHAHSIPLGLILLQRGWISEAQLIHVLEMQRRERYGRIGDWLTSACGVGRDRITRALAMQWDARH
jgi:hypothetical protein